MMSDFVTRLLLIVVNTWVEIQQPDNIMKLQRRPRLLLSAVLP